MASDKNTSADVEVIQVSDDNLSLAEAEKRSKFNKILIAVLTISISLFHIFNVSGIFTMSTMTIRIIHLMVMMVLAFLTKKSKSTKHAKLDKILRYTEIAITVFASIYLLFRWQDISNSGGATNQMDIIVGLLMLVVVLESADNQWTFRWPLSVDCSSFILLSDNSCPLY